MTIAERLRKLGVEKGAAKARLWARESKGCVLPV
jgi:hypothetical protein